MYAGFFACFKANATATPIDPITFHECPKEAAETIRAGRCIAFFHARGKGRSRIALTAGAREAIRQAMKTLSGGIAACICWIIIR
jgi:hypothetical protein